jgi:hypothetical protein
MKMTASRNLEEVENDAVQTSKIKAALELVEKSSRIGGKLSSLLGTQKTDNFDNLIEYVGADGRYVSITKSVTIYYPKEWLKGVEIVDTPGFNDPVVSREERTQEFLKKADVVVLLLYAGRAFDATDRDILFDKVQNVGIGKVLIGVNKYDLCFSQGETIEEIKINVSKEIKKACKETGDILINDLLQNLDPVLFSANMALMAKMPIEKIKKNDDLKFHWDKACDDFEITSQAQMLNKSRISDLEDAIKNIIDKSKQEILIRKPLNMILQAGINAQKKIELEINEKKRLVETLSIPDDELEERITNLGKVQNRIRRKAERIVEDMEESFNEETDRTIKKLEDTTDSAHLEMLNIADTEKRSAIDSRLRNRYKTLKEREIPRIEEGFKKNLRRILLDNENEFCNDIEDVIHKYLTDSEDLIEDAQHIVKQDSIKIDFAANNDSDNTNDTDEDNDTLTSILGILGSLLILPAIICWFNERSDIKENIDTVFDGISYDYMREKVQPIREKYIKLLQIDSVSEILNKLMEQLEGAQTDKTNREKNLAEANEKLNVLENNKTKIESQMKEMNELKMTFI